MSINETLLYQISDHLSNYHCTQKEIEDFLSTEAGSKKRQCEAIKIVKNIMTVRGKKKLFSHLTELGRIERGIRVLQGWIRDHVGHAVLNFILGIYINEKFLRSSTSVAVDGFQWELAGLFHDIGYPTQVAIGILEPFAETIKGIKEALLITSPNVYFEIRPRELERLSNGVNSFQLIQDRLNEWDLEINAKGEYNRITKAGKMCHGIISGLTILYVIDLMYQKYNPKRQHKCINVSGDNQDWNQANFEKDVVSACTAIYIHNLPGKCFKNKKINRSKAPIAFLLKLSDILQDWERPSHENPKGIPPDKFDIEIVRNELLLTAYIPDKSKDEIRKEISSTLIAHDVGIR